MDFFVYVFLAFFFGIFPLSACLNKGAPGIDGMTIEDALLWLREHREELMESIRQGKYKPQPVRRKEIPKPDGGVRKLGIPTVIDRIIQQAIAQQLVPIYEPLFFG